MKNKLNQFFTSRHKIFVSLRYITLAGNIIFVLWIIRNGINEGFKATLIEKVSISGLILLLMLNSLLIYSFGKHR
jgi:hypothetical protein